MVLVHLSKSNSSTFQGFSRTTTTRTELHQTGTFISIYKQVQFTFNNLTPSSINWKLELSEKNYQMHQKLSLSPVTVF